MAYLLRQARLSAWNGETVITSERQALALGSFARRPEDTDGISLYAFVQPSDEQLVVSALACNKMEHGRLDLLHIEDATVGRFGAVAPVVGTMPIRKVNPLHRTLDWSSEQLAALVGYLLDLGAKATRYPEREVIRAILALGAEDVDEGPHREWVLKIHREKAKRA